MYDFGDCREGEIPAVCCRGFYLRRMASEESSSRISLPLAPQGVSVKIGEKPVCCKHGFFLWENTLSEQGACIPLFAEGRDVR